jgi:capsular polysaccharide export protein
MKLYSAFRRVLVDRCLIRGGLLSDQGLQMLVDNAVDRLVKDRVQSGVLVQIGARRRAQANLF